MTLLLLLRARGAELPALTLKTVLTFGEKKSEGMLIRAVALPWFEILDAIRRDPTAIYRIDHRRWEEIIAGAYERAGFDEVVLTPRSADKGRDVIAIRHGVGSVRFIDQVKAYRPGHLVTAEEVRSMLGVMSVDPNVSKGLVTTTSAFAPGIAKDPGLQSCMPHRLELKARGELLAWLADLTPEPTR